ncbi:MAG: GTPase HflX [Nitrospinota bacterium]
MYRRKIPPEQLITWEAARLLVEISTEIRRQVGLLIERRGEIRYVIVGDPRSIFIPDLRRERAGGQRLRGLRCVHTHLSGEALSRDDLTDLALLRLDLMAALTLQEGTQPVLPGDVHLAHLLPENPENKPWEILDPVPLDRLELNCAALTEHLERELTRVQGGRARIDHRERVILVHVAGSHRTRDNGPGSLAARRDPEASLEELKELARSSGLVILDTVIQRRQQPDPRTVLGRGKLQELVIQSLQLGADVIVLDRELTPGQLRSISEFTDLKVIDRSQLILDIFAQRAKSRDGKIQVELAQLKYLLPRLVGQDGAMSRLAGGIGTRGPGEMKLEIDRRRIRGRIARLERELQGLDRGRSQRRARRRRNELPILSIVGYTNVGKSTLLNALTHSRVGTEDLLFATLDPTSRRLRFPQEMEVILTDTVGFIHDLPQELMAAFRATLAELEDADLLIHLVDVSNPRFEEQMAAVQRILLELGLDEIPRLLVFNKTDLVDPCTVQAQTRRFDAVGISALHPETLTPLIARAQRMLWKKFRKADSASRPAVATQATT